MGDSIRHKSLEISLTCYIIIGIVLWGILFLLSPKYIEFSVSKEQVQMIPNIENRKIIINNLNVNSFSEYINKEKEAKQTQDIAGGSIFIYGILGYLFIFLNERKIVHKVYLPIIICFLFILYFVANAYYDFMFKPFISITEDFFGYFIFIKSLPFIVIFYLFFRMIIVKHSGKEPKLVGKAELFTDPFNWLFTICVLLFGMCAGYFAPWF